MNPLLRFLLLLHPGSDRRVKGERGERVVGSNYKKSLFLLSPEFFPPSVPPKSCPAELRPGLRYFPRFLLLLRPAGTAAKDDRRSFVCPDFSKRCAEQDL
ncbi:hypothetical protein BH11PLA2_BH11PLA2_36940 [soil metagenome]